jgi:hypothetical protein
MTQLHHRHRFHGWHERSPFPVYLVRDSDHVPDIEIMMERHHLLRLGNAPAWLEHVTVQRVPAGFLVYIKLGDATQMSHHPEYQHWLREALPLDDALGAGWRTISEAEAREMLGESVAS